MTYRGLNTLFWSFIGPFIALIILISIGFANVFLTGIVSAASAIMFYYGLRELRQETDVFHYAEAPALITAVVSSVAIFVQPALNVIISRGSANIFATFGGSYNLIAIVLPFIALSTVITILMSLGVIYGLNRLNEPFPARREVTKTNTLWAKAYLIFSIISFLWQSYSLLRVVSLSEQYNLTNDFDPLVQALINFSGFTTLFNWIDLILTLIFIYKLRNAYKFFNGTLKSHQVHY